MLINLRTTLLASSSITDVVGTNIFPYHIPQTATLPAISMNVISRINDGTLDLGRAMLTRYRIQIDCWSTDYNQATTLANALELILDGFKGDLSGQYVGECYLDGGQEFWEGVEGDDNGTYHIATDFMFLIANN